MAYRSDPLDDPRLLKVGFSALKAFVGQNLASTDSEDAARELLDRCTTKFAIVNLAEHYQIDFSALLDREGGLRLAEGRRRVGATLESQQGRTTPPSSTRPTGVPRPNRKWGVAAWAQSQWKQEGGPAIEPLLSSGAVALLNAAWVIQLAEQPGAILPRRQDLPGEAFLPLDTLKAAGSVSGGLRIALLSYPWTHPVHPDKFGHTLRLVANVLKHFAAWEVRENRPPTWGLFWE